MNPSLIYRAYSFADQAHRSVNQRRRYSGAPYITHPLAVAQGVASVTDDAHLVAAALLHDVLEDTPTTADELQSHFGADVAGLVMEVTDVSRPEDGNRAARKALDRAHVANASSRGQTLKLADLIDNTRSIVHFDPDFARVYLREKAALLEVLVGGSPRLQHLAWRLVRDSMRFLDM